MGKKEKKMKKSKIKMLTAAACLALVGTASAAWVYAGTATESANIGVKVASYASAGKITVTGNDNYYLYLDRGSVKFKQKVEGTNLIATHDTSEFDSTTTSAKTPTLTYTITLTGYLSQIVEFTDCDNEATSDNDGVFTRVSDEYTWESGKAIALPNMNWAIHYDTTGDTTYHGKTYDNMYYVEDNYKSLITKLNGTGVGTDWNKNDEIDVNDQNLITINFKAVVAA